MVSPWTTIIHRRVAKLAKRTTLKMLHEDTLRVQIPPCRPLMPSVAAGGRKLLVEVESRPNLIANSMTCELNTNPLRILTVVFGNPNRLTAITNNYLAEPYSWSAATACRVLTLEKRTCCATTQVYGFGNYPTKNKLHRKTWICLLNYHFWDNMWHCGWTVYKKAK